MPSSARAGDAAPPPDNVVPAGTVRVGVADFFCGCGGVSCGFRQATVPGVRAEILAGVDLDPHCCRTYERMIGVRPDRLDVRDLLARPGQFDTALRHRGGRRCDRLVLVGCAPCQGFAAHRQAIPADDVRRNLLVVFSEIVARLRPDAVFMENVPDLFSGRHWPYYARACSNLESAGYRVRARVYNFAAFGLPQERFRAVILAMRRPFPMPEGRRTPEHFRTVRDAIGHLPPLHSGEADPTDPMHAVSRHRPETLRILARVPRDGGSRPPGIGPGCLDVARARHGGYTDVYGRLAWDRPSVTLTGKCRTPSCGRFAHPEQDRGLSVREAALLQGFPPDYVFDGPSDSRYTQIGNAVPPLVARVFAEHLLTLLAGRTPEFASDDRSLDVEHPVGPGFAVTINGIKRKGTRRERIKA